MKAPEEKILSRTEAAAFARKLREAGKTLVFTNGCFDVLHAGHAYLLNEARKQGDALMLALNSDQSVRRLKGESRPVNKEEDRALLLASLQAVDAVVIFEEDTPEELISVIRPDVLVKGGDYNKEEVVGARLLESYGGKVMIVPLKPGYSSSKTIENLKKN